MVGPLVAGVAALSGGLVGFSLGLIGGGGSALAMPLLLYVVGVPRPHVAIGTGALAVAVNAYIGLFGHARARTVRWRPAIIFAGVGIVGAFIGSTIGKAVDGQRLLFLFGVAMIAIGISMLRPVAKDEPAHETEGLGLDIRVAAVAFVAGLAAGFFGIGGGVLIVPALMFATGMAMINAIGSSLFAVGTLALTTAVNYARSGLVDWPVALEFISGGVVGAFLGMRLAVRIREKKQVLRRIFAVVMFAVAAYVLYRSGGSILA